MNGKRFYHLNYFLGKSKFTSQKTEDIENNIFYKGRLTLKTDKSISTNEILEQCFKSYLNRYYEDEEDEVSDEDYIIVFCRETGKCFGQARFSYEVIIPEPEFDFELLEIIE